MSETALQQLRDAQATLNAALESHDIDAVDAANAALVVAIEEARVAGGWHDRPGLRNDLIHVLQLAEGARGRVNALTDLNRRKLDKLISLAGPPRALAYGRSGRLR